MATVMKHSRQQSLCRQGMLHLHPVDGVVCFPLDVGTPAELQPHHDMLLVKATDFLHRVHHPEGGLAVEFAPALAEVWVPDAQDAS